MTKKTLKNKSLKLIINSDKSSNNKLNAISKQLNQRIDKIEAVSKKLNQQINKLNNVLEQLKQRIDERIDERSVSNNVVVGGWKDIKDMNDFDKPKFFLDWADDKIDDIKDIRYKIYKHLQKLGYNANRPDTEQINYLDTKMVLDDITELSEYYAYIKKFIAKHDMFAGGPHSSGGGDHEEDAAAMMRRKMRRSHILIHDDDDTDSLKNMAIKFINKLEINYTNLYNSIKHYA